MSYDNLTTSDGLLTHSQLRLSKDDVLAAKSVRIISTSFSPAIAQGPFTEPQKRLITNAIDRSLCLGLSDRFQIASPAQTADLTVHAVVTHVAATDATMAGVSKVASVAPSLLLPGVPVPVPRVPIGLGSLSVEAEARGQSGNQVAAMVWARGANSFTSSPRVSTEGDAYDLASEFGDDFSKLLVTGKSPFGTWPAPPSLDKVKASFGAAPKQVACETFGRSPGLPGAIEKGLGLPPSWADNGSAADSAPKKQSDTDAVAETPVPH